MALVWVQTTLAATTQSVGSARTALEPDQLLSASVSPHFDYKQTPHLKFRLLPLPEEVASSLPANGIGPQRVGIHRKLPSASKGNLSQQLRWYQGNGNTAVAAISVASPGARAIRLAIRVKNLGEGELRFFGSDSSQKLPPFDQQILRTMSDTSGLFWSPVLLGEFAGVEISVPWDSRHTLQISVEDISHIFAEFGPQNDEPGLCPNVQEVQCYESVIAEGLEDAVAKYIFEDDGGSYKCTGTLLNDTIVGDESIPYFLTANHCVYSDEAAKTVSVEWFYQYSSCGDNEIDARYTQSHGAELLKTSRHQDATLLRLQGPLPGGLTLAGWRADQLRHPTSVYSISHPLGTEKKYAEGETSGFTSGYISDDFVADLIDVSFRIGVTQGGSSGSGLFRMDDASLVGILAGGVPGCETPTEDSYGNFAEFFPLVMQWLAPDGGERAIISAPPSAVAVETGLTSGHIEGAHDVNLFQIELTTAGVFQIESSGPMPTEGTIYRDDARLTLLDEGSSGGRNFSFTGSVPAGVYLIEVRGLQGATGYYSFNIAFDAHGSPDDHADSPNGATNLEFSKGFNTLDAEVQGELNWDRDLDYFRIELKHSGQFQITSTGTANTVGALISAQGETLVEQQHGTAASHFQIKQDLDAGVYYLEVRGLDAMDQGIYGIQASFLEDREKQDDHGDWPSLATILTEDVSMDGRLEASNDIDFFRIDLDDPSTVWLETSSGIDIRGVLFDVDGNVIRDDIGEVDVLIADDLEPGAYYVELRGATDTVIGRYSLIMLSDSKLMSGTMADATFVSIPSSTESRVTTEDEKHLYQFKVNEAGTLFATTLSELSTTGRLLTFNGTLLVKDTYSGEGSNFLIEHFVREGIYFIEVEGPDLHSWSKTTYVLELSVEPVVVSAIDVTIPSSTRDELDGDDDLDGFKIDVTVPGQLLVEISGNQDPQIQLVGPNGHILVENDSEGEEQNSRIKHDVRPGTYWVKVSGSQPGTYTLNVTQPETPQSVTLPWSAVRPTKGSGHFTYFRIDISELGQLTAYTMGRANTTGVLLAEDGTELFHDDSSYDSSNFIITTVVRPGTYFVGGEGEKSYSDYSDEYGIVLFFNAQRFLHAERVNVPSTTQGKLKDSKQEQDLFQFDLPIAGQLRIQTEGTERLHGILYAYDGSLLLEAQGDYSDPNFSITSNLPSGRYYIEVAGASYFDEGAPYDLLISHTGHVNQTRLGDFDGDQKDDLLLRHTTGYWSFNQLNGRHLASSTISTALTHHRHWRLGTIADMNGDGNSDLLLRHWDGRWFLHPMSGAESLQANRGAQTLTQDVNWHVVSTGDFDGNGSNEVLLRHVSTGRWQHHNPDQVESNKSLDLPADLAWHPLAAGDFDGDGQTELLLRYTNGFWRYVELGRDNARWDFLPIELGSSTLSPSAVAVGDFNGDGNEDLLLRDDQGQWEYHALDGHVRIGSASGHADLLEKDLAWQVAGSGDLNGDGKDDLLFRHSNGNWRYYAMNGRHAITTESGSANLPVSLEWGIPPLPSDDLYITRSIDERGSASLTRSLRRRN